MTHHYKKNLSESIYTLTTEGLIPAVIVNGVELCVKTDGPIDGDGRYPPKPLKNNDGDYVYAVPGGDSFAGGRFYREDEWAQG